MEEELLELITGDMTQDVAKAVRLLAGLDDEVSYEDACLFANLHAKYNNDITEEMLDIVLKKRGNEVCQIVEQETGCQTDGGFDIGWEQTTNNGLKVIKALYSFYYEWASDLNISNFPQTLYSDEYLSIDAYPDKEGGVFLQAEEKYYVLV